MPVEGNADAVRVLVLAGTTEARQLAHALDRLWPRVELDIGASPTSRRCSTCELTVSFAGRTSTTAFMPGTVRVGGFGGATGLADFVRSERIDAVVDATHPFAAVMPFNAATACAATGTPLLRLLRPPWIQTPHDRWVRVGSLQQAADEIAALGMRRVLLTTGRQELRPFAGLVGVDLTIRSIEPPDLSGFDEARVHAILDRGPFTVDSELALLTRRSIEAIVTKNSGGAATIEKLEAARRLGLIVIIVDRPPAPDVETVSTVAEAVEWLGRRERIALSR